jgi:hypothetical protein
MGFDDPFGTYLATSSGNAHISSPVMLQLAFGVQGSLCDDLWFSYACDCIVFLYPLHVGRLKVLSLVLETDGIDCMIAIGVDFEE